MMMSHDMNDERTEDTFLDKNLTFEHMLLREDILKGLTSNGFIYPTVIQKKGIPLGRCDYDLLIQSKSGTGKTLVYSVVVLDKFESEITSPQSLIITPTREIAVQVADTLSALGKYVQGFKVAPFIGGLDVKENRKMVQNCTCVVGTPGRILHLINTNVFNLKYVKVLVLDEVDLLTDDNFELDKIFDKFVQKMQVVCASATVDKKVEEKVKRFLKNPIGVTPKREIPVLLGVGQFHCRLEESNEIEMIRKFQKLKQILSTITFKQCFVFTNSQSQAESYKQLLQKEAWPSEVITGAYDQKKRLEVYRKLKEFKIRVLLSTDLMARGIDAENVNLVINMDVPINSAVYLHRIGRAGRFGTKGLAVTLLSNEKQEQYFKDLLTQIGEFQVFEFPVEPNDKEIWNFAENSSKFEPISNQSETLDQIKGDPDISDDFTNLLLDNQTDSVPMKITNIIEECDNFETSLVLQNPIDLALSVGLKVNKLSNLFDDFNQFAIGSDDDDQSMPSNIDVDPFNSDENLSECLEKMSINLNTSEASIRSVEEPEIKALVMEKPKSPRKKKRTQHKVKADAASDLEQSDLTRDWMKMYYSQANSIMRYVSYLNYIRNYK